MKNIVYLIVGCIWMSSCGDFLKEASQDLVYATSCEDLDEVMIGNGYMKNGAVSSYSDALYYPWLQVMDDDIEELGYGSFSITGSAVGAVLRPFYGWYKVPFQTSKGMPYDDTNWQKLYGHIGYLNVIIAQVKEFMDDPEEVRNRITGEALFLRATYYYLLVNMYAKPYQKESASAEPGVPLKLTEKVEDKYFSRHSVGEVYRQIVADLQNAADRLKGIEQPTIYRVNEAAARTLLSRVYLYMGEWKLALEECEKVMALGAPLWDLNKLKMADVILSTDAGKYSKEQYICMGSSPELLFTQGSNSGHILMVDGKGTLRYCISTELKGLYEKYGDVEDLRLKGYFSTSRDNVDQTRYIVRKSSHLAATIAAFDGFIIRTPEVYLNKAEAEAMLDKTEAIGTLKDLMTTRFKDGKIPAIDHLSGENLVKFIREERRRELCFESQRWFDLRRYAVCPRYPESKVIEHPVYLPGVSSASEGVLDGTYVLESYGKETAYVLPIPGYEVSFNNGEMVDNPERVDRTPVR